MLSTPSNEEDTYDESDHEMVDPNLDDEPIILDDLHPQFETTIPDSTDIKISSNQRHSEAKEECFPVTAPIWVLIKPKVDSSSCNKFKSFTSKFVPHAQPLIYTKVALRTSRSQVGENDDIIKRMLQDYQGRCPRPPRKRIKLEKFRNFKIPLKF